MPFETLFHYRPACSAMGCREPAEYKIAANWSDGSSRELKNYGLACEGHRDGELATARRHHEGLKLAPDETVGPVQIYLLRAGIRDAQLVPLEPPGAEASPHPPAGKPAHRPASRG